MVSDSTPEHPERGIVERIDPQDLIDLAEVISEGYGLGDLPLGFTATLRMLRGSAVEIERLSRALTDRENAALREERDMLRSKLIQWDNHTDSAWSSVRDELAELVASSDPARPYFAADAIRGVINSVTDEADTILYDIIPEDRWGLPAASVDVPEQGASS